MLTKKREYVHVPAFFAFMKNLKDLWMRSNLYIVGKIFRQVLTNFERNPSKIKDFMKKLKKT